MQLRHKACIPRCLLNFDIMTLNPSNNLDVEMMGQQYNQQIRSVVNAYLNGYVYISAKPVNWPGPIYQPALCCFYVYIGISADK